MQQVEYEYVINSAIKDRGLPLKAVGDVLAVVPTYFLSKRTDDMKQVNEKIDKTMKEMRADGTLKKLSEKISWWGLHIRSNTKITNRPPWRPYSIMYRNEVLLWASILMCPT